MEVDFFECSRCSEDVSELNERHCPTCSNDLGCPNVRDVGRPESTAALKERYEDALRASQERGVRDTVHELEEESLQTKAVVSMSLDNLKSFSEEGSLYSTYRHQVEGQMRKSAKRQSDKERTGVEGTVFGGYSKEIRYAALSLDGRGLPSYGNYFVTLKDVAIERRATLLEENTYHFVERHGIVAGSPIPLGYSATWNNRHELVVAKLASHVAGQNSSEGYASLILFSEGKRNTDDFIEVHIYGAFDLGAVSSVRGPSAAASTRDRAKIAVIEERLEAAGKEWIDI